MVTEVEVLQAELRRLVRRRARRGRDVKRLWRRAMKNAPVQLTLRSWARAFVAFFKPPVAVTDKHERARIISQRDLISAWLGAK